MADILKVLTKHTKNAFEVLSSNEIVDEKTLDTALYQLICIEDDSTISDYLAEFYELDKIKNYALKVQQDRVRKKTLKLLRTLQEFCSNSFINSTDVWHIRPILTVKNLRYAKRYFHYFLNDCKLKGKHVDFDFDVYRMTKCVSQLSEMNSIKGYSTKMILLQYYLENAIYEIFEGVYKVLNSFNVIDNNKHKTLNRIQDLFNIVPHIISICVNDEPEELTNISDTEKAKLLRKYCIVFPSLEKNLEHLIGVLDKMKDWYKIPHRCNKKTFAVFTYILFKHKNYLKIKSTELNTYTRFRKVMCLYYGMPEPSYKINDIKELAKDEERSFCYKDFE